MNVILSGVNHGSTVVRTRPILMAAPGLSVLRRARL